MTERTHLALDGSWATCAIEAEVCPSVFHIDLDVDQARAMPQQAVEALAEIMDPPSFDYDIFEEKEWLDERNLTHRDYDLPAVIKMNGDRQWWRHGSKHRDGAKPAVIYPSGKVEYWVHGVRQSAPETDGTASQHG